MGPGRATKIGVGLVARDGHYLVRRRPVAPLAGFWEFPGGKCLPGEDPRSAALRECREELGRDVVVAETARWVIAHEYPHGLLEIHFHDAALADPESDLDSYRGFLWVAAADLSGLPFPEANRAIVMGLAEMAASRSGPSPAG